MALGLLSDPAADPIERATMQRVIRRLIPLLMMCYFIAYLDRVNVGFAGISMNQRPAFQRRGIRLRQRHLLRRLFPLRDSQQPAHGESRGAPMDRPHPDHLGHHFRPDRRGAGRGLVLRHPFPARRGRSRLLSRHHPLHHLVVSHLLSLPDHRPVHDRHPVLRHRRLDHLGHLAGAGRQHGPGRLAMAVHHRGSTSDHPRHRGPVLPHRPARRRALAAAGSAQMARPIAWRQSASSANRCATTDWAEAMSQWPRSGC